jgi:hypothetical protein
LMAPLAFIPEPVAIALLELVLIAGAVWTVRHLRLPWVFLLWPPLWGSVMVGNPNALLVGLLVTAIAPLAVVFKVYAIVPLIGLRRWRAVAVSGALLAVTAIVLPWATYVREFGTIDGHLEEQARHLSAWGEPMILLVIPALFVLGRRRASWLAVPGLWPSTQLGYHVLALPVMRNPWVAIGLSIPVPLVAPATIVAWAGVRLARVRGPRLVSALRALGARPDSGLDVAS